jgi:hypothetical protein
MLGNCPEMKISWADDLQILEQSVDVQILGNWVLGESRSTSVPISAAFNCNRHCATSFSDDKP